MSVDACLIRPPEDILKTWYDRAESLGIGYLTSYSRGKGHSVEVIDSILQDLTWEEVAQRILEADPKVVGFSVLEIAFENVVKISKEIRSNGYGGHICLGGHYPTFAYEKILKTEEHVDSIIRFEGEAGLAALISAVKSGSDWRKIEGLAYKENGKIIENEIPKLVKDLDKLTFPARDHLKLALETNPTITVSASRGCWCKCKFCTVTAFYGIPEGKRWRGRSPRNIVDEIENVTRKYDCDSITFIDDNYIGPGTLGIKHAQAIAEEIMKRDLKISYSIECRSDAIEEELFSFLKKSGLKCVFMGVESGLDKRLKMLGKKSTREINDRAIRILKSLDITVVPGFLLYDPDITLDEVIKEFEYLKSYDVFEFPTLIRKLELRQGMELMDKITDISEISGTDFAYKYFRKDKRVEAFYATLLEVFERYAIAYLRIKDVKRNNDRFSDVCTNIMQKLTVYSINLAIKMAQYHLKRKTTDNVDKTVIEAWKEQVEIDCRHIFTILSLVSGLSKAESSEVF